MNILIHSLEQGYVVTDYITGRKYAKETAEGVIEVLREMLGMSADKSSTKQEKEVFVHDTSREGHFEKISVFPEPAPKTIPTAQMKDPDDLLIPHFKYDPAQVQIKEIEGYTNISVMELPDGRAIIQYRGTHYYTTKEKMMQIPYPVTRNYFKKKGLSLSSVARTCLAAYRQHLHLASMKDKDVPKGDEQGTCDDVTFESCANNSPESCKFCMNESRFEDKNKLAAKKPAPPLMHATIEP